MLLAGCGGDGSGPKAGDPVKAATVQIASYHFSPAVVALEPGGSVTWSNQDPTPHTATSDDGRAFDSGTLQFAASRRVRLTRRGTVSYHCTFHRFMVARVVVK